MVDPLIDEFERGDRQALSRLLSLASRGESLDALLDQLPRTTQRSVVVAVTGSGGVGKSTLIGKLLPIIRKEKQSVAVLACDPRSPLTGGALLGDRFRMPASPEDDGVFIRSLAAAPGQGSVAANLPVMIQLLKAYGFDWVVIETVGAGQGDTGVRDLADVVVLLLQPETGDDLQWEKAGLLEVADIIVVHKADLPGSERTEAQVRDILGLSSGKTAKVVRASSKSGQGIEELWQAIRNVGQTIRVLRYHDIGPLSHSEAEAIFDSGDVRQMATALVALGLHDHDWKWVQEQCLRFLSHESEVMVSAAIVSLGHTARINRSINKDVVLPALQSVAVDPRFTGKVQDALEDIDLFAKGS